MLLCQRGWPAAARETVVHTEPQLARLRVLVGFIVSICCVVITGAAPIRSFLLGRGFYLLVLLVVKFSSRPGLLKLGWPDAPSRDGAPPPRESERRQGDPPQLAHCSESRIPADLILTRSRAHMAGR